MSGSLIIKYLVTQVSNYVFFNQFYVYGGGNLRNLATSVVTVALVSHSVFAQDLQTVKGIIKDVRGEAIIGASVRIKGTNLGASTDLDGRFAIAKVKPGSVVEVSSVGYISKSITFTGQKLLSISLSEDNKQLSDVVVVGYGKVKKGDLSTAVATVGNVEGLKERPIGNIEEMLQGQIPGVTVIANGGHPDSKPSIMVRGIGSRNNESPLYVVDGVPNAPFSFSDVVSMTVLKDAASAAIYGAYAGSAGVILVTTKQAKAGKLSVEYSGVTGLSQATNLPQSLTIEEQRRVRAFAMGGEANLPPGWDVSKNPYIGKTRTDWIDEIFRLAPFQRHSLAISAGTESFSNRLSAEYSDRQGTLISTYNKEFNLRLNSSFNLSKYLRIREDISFKNVRSRGANTTSAESGVILSALMMPRNAEVYNADGTFGGTSTIDPEYIAKYGGNYSGIHGDVINPVRSLTANAISNNRDRLSSSTFLDIIEPIKGLNFTSRFTFDLENYFYRAFSPRRTEPGKPDPRNSLSYTASRNVSWSWENTLSYDRVFAHKHNLSLMASTTASSDRERYFGVTGREFDSEEESVRYFAQTSEFEPANDGLSLDRNFSLVARAGYSYAGRYFATASIRRDYAGRLPEGKKFGDFPSATLAWKLSNEPFMPRLKWLDDVKFRFSWGRVGNLGSIERSYSKFRLSNSGRIDRGTLIGADAPIRLGKYLRSHYNPNLTWEISEQIDLGLDIALFDKRLQFTADYFVKKTFGLIKEQDSGWPTTIGRKPMLVNDGEIHNRGFEFSLSWADKRGEVDYWINANLATLNNKVHYIGSVKDNGEKPVWTENVSFKGLRPYRTEEGMPLYSFWLVKTQGVFTSQAEIDAHKSKEGKPIQPKAQVGDLRFVDINGDGTINNGDRVFMGNAMPKITYAISGGLAWRGFNFSMLWQGVGGVKIFNAYKYLTLNETGTSFNRSNKILAALDGPTPSVPRISANDENNNFTTNSDFYLEDGDFLRLKNLTLGYTFKNPIKYLPELALGLSIDNVLTLTRYTGIDPEVGSIGFDTGQYPVSRTYSLSLKLKF